MKLFLIDPNPLALDELDRFLSTKGFEVVGASADCVAAELGIAASRPGVVVADPYNSSAARKGASALRRVTEQFPATHFLVFSMNPPDVFASRALQAGANAYISKTRPEDLAEVIRLIAAGRPLPEPVLYPLEAKDRDPIAVLAPRQLQTLVLTGSGYKTADVARLFGRSTKTVDTFKGGIKKRLGISHFVALATFAAKWLHDNPLLAAGVEQVPGTLTTPHGEGRGA